MIKIGHLYPTNISRYLIYKLFDNWFKFEDEEKTRSIGFLEEPKPLLVKEVVNHFLDKINQMKFTIKTIKDKKFYSNEELISQKKIIKTLKSLMKEKFGVNCAE